MSESHLLLHGSPAVSRPAGAVAACDGRRSRGDRTRSRILEAALPLASLQGLDGVTIGRVAESAGVSKGHLATLFGNREGLQIAVLEAAAAVWHQQVDLQIESASSPREALLRYCLGWYDSVEQRIFPGGCIITAAWCEFRAMDGVVRDHLVGMRGRLHRNLRALVSAVLGEKAPSGAIDDAVHDLLAYQAAANVTALLDDPAAFAHSRKRTISLIDSLPFHP